MPSHNSISVSKQYIIDLAVPLNKSSESNILTCTFQKMLLLLFIFGLLINFKTIHCGVDRCHSKLFDGCFCGASYIDRRQQFVVNCTNTGFLSADMLQKLPEETEILIFTGNNVPTLPINIFGNMSNLRIIDMSNNQIKDIKGRTFHHVPNVKRLILNHNNISISNEGDENYHHPRVFSNFENLEELHLTNAFADNTDAALANDLHDIFVNSNLTKLYKLHLEQNEIKNFKDANVFCDLPSLHQLYLSDNFLPGLNFNVRCLKKLAFLDLEHNNITKLTASDLDSLDTLSFPYRNESLTIDVSRNPFRCDNAISKLYTWMHRTNVTIRNRDYLQCTTSKNGKRYIFTLNSLVDAKHAKYSKAIVVLLVVLVLILVSLLSAYAYLSRDKIKTRLHPILDVVTRKVQYTTIESQDV